MPTLDNWELKFDADDILRAQGADPAAIRSRRPSLVDVAERALEEATPMLRPVVHYRQLPVEGLTHQRLSLAGGGLLSGPLVQQHLAPAEQVVLAGCTVGRTVEEHAAQKMASDPIYGLALNGVGSAAAEALAIAVCHYFEEQAASEGMKATIPINPGMEGWPVHEGQQQLFGFLDVDEMTIQLLPSGLMSPLKSVSLVIGLGADVDKTGGPCDFCKMRDRCRFRSD